MKHTFKLTAIMLVLSMTLALAGCSEKKAADPNKRTTVQDGDTIHLDFTGYIDGKTFDGGGTGGFGDDLEIGSGTYIDGFEEGCIGHEIGETFELPLTFPDDYDNPNLAGKDVVFKVKILDILE